MFFESFRLRFFPCLLAALALVPSCATAEDTLSWGVFDFPPFQIIEEPHKGSGSFDGELQTLIASMPEFKHQIVAMSFARRREEFIAGTNFCTPGIFHAPAAALKLAISVPALTHLDNRVIFLKDKAHLFGNSDPINLDTLFNNKKLIGAVVAGRSYSPNIDDTIKRFHGSLNLMIRPLETSQLFQMLLSGDVDYLILFPHEARYLADKFEAVDRITNRQIKGTPPYIYTHVACSGNDWGRATIKKINAVLLAERNQPNYQSFSERWYPPEDQQRIKRYYPAMLQEH